MGIYLSKLRDTDPRTLIMNHLLLTVLALTAIGATFATPIHSNVVSREFQELTELDLEDIKDLDLYGLIDLFPGIGKLIEDLKPIIQEKVDILLDPNLTMQEKVKAIVDVCKSHADQLIKIVGDFGLNAIIKTILPGIIAAMG